VGGKLGSGGGDVVQEIHVAIAKVRFHVTRRRHIKQGKHRNTIPSRLLITLAKIIDRLLTSILGRLSPILHLPPLSWVLVALCTFMKDLLDPLDGVLDGWKGIGIQIS